MGERGESLNMLSADSSDTSSLVEKAEGAKQADTRFREQPPPSPPLSDPTTEQDKPRLSSSETPLHGQDVTQHLQSTKSDKQANIPSSNGDRVFPISSVVHVDPSQTPSILNRQNSYDQQEYFPPGATGIDIASARQRRQSSCASEISEGQQRPEQPRSAGERSRSESRKKSSSRAFMGTDRYGGGSRMQIFNDAESDRSADASHPSSIKGIETQSSTGLGDEGSLSGHVTARFKHIVTAEGHAVITGRDGETLQRCEDEPIHIPGAVQGFGLLVALEEVADGELLVRVVSENSQKIIGYTPRDLFKLKSFTEILSDEQADNLWDHVDFIRDDDADPAANGPEVFTITIRSPKPARKTQKLWCGMHIHPSYPDLIICEFELDEDSIFPLVPPDENTPESPEDTLQSNPTPDEFAASTQNSSKPLRILRSARKRRGEAAAMQVFNIMSQVQEQLASAINLDNFLKILVGVVKELTGFHRVMIYQFDSAFNGRVVTELVDPRATKDLYMGLNFPASDIPQQARDLYKVNKVRLLYDRDLETARLVCRSVEDLERPLDLSFSYLRAMSPIHIKYLANMSVRSSMSISINAFNELWGLIACHSYGNKGMRVSFPIRKMCRLIGDTASRNIERLSYASRLQARKLINTIPTEANPSGYIIASSEDLLKLFDADFGLLSIRGETKIMGRLEQSQEALAMLQYLRMRKITSVITSQDIKTDFPDLRYSPGFDVIAGLLLVPLSVGGADFIVFLRKGQVKEVKWAGNPYEKFVKEGTEGYLEPRKSFKTWSETVLGKCRDWTEEQVETAAVLCLVYGKFIEVWRQKEAALQSSQLTRLLLANSAHEVRTPLNAIINYLEIALEGALDQETRDNLAKSHSASKSLIYVINDLLDLTKTEEGQDLIKDELFDLPVTVREAFDSFKGDATRKGLEYELIEHPGIPQFVHGDQRRIRQCVANIIANAIQYTSKGWIHVEMWYLGPVEGEESAANVEIGVQDSGSGMSTEKLDSLFRDLEQVSPDGDGPLMSSDEFEPSQQKDKRVLGLGLAMVSRIVRNMDGQFRVKSEEGNGSRFIIQLPFTTVVDRHTGGNEKHVSSKQSAHQSEVTATTSPPTTEGEVTLIEKSSSLRGDKDSSLHRRSVDGLSFKSASSARSNNSARSDVDRLIDAISGPLSTSEPQSPGKALQRRGSRGSRESRDDDYSYRNSNPNVGQMQPLGRSKPGLTRARSYNAPEHLRSLDEGPPGTEYVADSNQVLRAVRMPDDSSTKEDDTPPHTASRVLFDIPDRTQQDIAERPRKLNADHLQILVAEDDPVNSKIIKKRLEKIGHNVYHTVNGEDCASAYGSQASLYDVVLMDMQMPIVDGLTSTKMIRSFEKTNSPSQLAPRASLNGRVPIFAVSASLLERERQTYIDAGFDGWILKPIDFKRLNRLLEGIVDEDVRNDCLYRKGEWERGGWFHRRQQSTLQPDTKPTQAGQSSPPGGDTHSGRTGSNTPTPSILDSPPQLDNLREPEETSSPITDRPFEIVS